jgi:chromosomal replication initiator protein
LKLSELKSPSRRQAIVAARGVAIYLARQLTDQSLDAIGKFFGRRDHTTILSSYRRTSELIASDPALRQAESEIRRMLVSA